MKSVPAKSDILLIGVSAEDLFEDLQEPTHVDKQNCKGRRYRIDSSLVSDALPEGDVYINEFSLHEIGIPWDLDDSDIFESVLYKKRLTGKSNEPGVFDMGPLATYLGEKTGMVVINDEYSSVLDTLRTRHDYHNLRVFDVMALGKDTLDYFNNRIKNEKNPELCKKLYLVMQETARDWLKSNSKPPVYDIEMEGNRFIVKGIGEVEFQAPVVVKYNVERKQITDVCYNGVKFNLPDKQERKDTLSNLFESVKDAEKKSIAVE